ARPRDDVAADVGDRDDRVVERRSDMRDAGLDVLPDLLLRLALDLAHRDSSVLASGLLLDRALLLHCHAPRSLARPRIGVRALTANGQALLVARTAVTAEV